MGVSASKIRKEVEASTEAAKTKQIAGIRLLEEMGRRVIEQFRGKVRLEKQNPFEFTLGEIITERSGIQLLTSDDTSKLKDSVKKIVDDFAKGDIVEAIYKVVNDGIDALLASGVGSVSEKKLYTVTLNAISVVRIDTVFTCISTISLLLGLSDLIRICLFTPTPSVPFKI